MASLSPKSNRLTPSLSLLTASLPHLLHLPLPSSHPQTKGKSMRVCLESGMKKKIFRNNVHPGKMWINVMKCWAFHLSPRGSSPVSVWHSTRTWGKVDVLSCWRVIKRVASPVIEIVWNWLSICSTSVIVKWKKNEEAKYYIKGWRKSKLSKYNYELAYFYATE